MKIGFVGGGNMASALIGGLIQSGKFQPSKITMSDLDDTKRSAWSARGVHTTANNQEVVDFSDVILFAVKPNVMGDVLKGLNTPEDKIYVSIAAGITIAFLEDCLGTDKKIVRTMPNTPAMVGCGMTVITPNKCVSADELQTVIEILSGVGETAVLEEKYINAAIGLHGSSPAYIYMLIDAMADSGVKYGLPKQIALKLAAKAVEGSAKMVLNSHDHPMKLKDDVCSPGGTTIAAVCELEKNGFISSIQSGIDACIQKAEEMSK